MLPRCKSVDDRFMIIRLPDPALSLKCNKAKVWQHRLVSSKGHDCAALKPDSRLFREPRHHKS